MSSLYVCCFSVWNGHHCWPGYCLCHDRNVRSSVRNWSRYLPTHHLTGDCPLTFAGFSPGRLTIENCITVDDRYSLFQEELVWSIAIALIENITIRDIIQFIMANYNNRLSLSEAGISLVSDSTTGQYKVCVTTVDW